MKRLERGKCHVDFANFALYNDILGVINKKYHNLPKAWNNVLDNVKSF